MRTGRYSATVLTRCLQATGAEVLRQPEVAEVGRGFDFAEFTRRQASKPDRIECEIGGRRVVLRPLREGEEWPQWRKEPWCSVFETLDGRKWVEEEVA